MLLYLQQIMKNPILRKFSSQRYDSKTLKPSLSTQHIKAQPDLPQLLMEKHELTLPSQQSQQQLSTYEWRSKTEFPIVKIHEYTYREKRTGKLQFEIQLEKYPIRLGELKDLPLFKILYILKESIIGFERLYNKFGSFPITSHMIALNQQHKCKVWLNQAFERNDFLKINIDESIFMKLLFKIVSQSSNKLKSTSKFLTLLSTCNTFCQSLTFIETFARQNKINVPSSCRILSKQIASREKNTTTFNPSTTMNRAPKIFQGNYLRSSLKQGFSLKSFGLPFLKNHLNQENRRQCSSKKTGDTADIVNSITFNRPNFVEKAKVLGSLTFGKKTVKRKFVFQSQTIKISNPKTKNELENNQIQRQPCNYYQSPQSPNTPCSMYSNFTDINDEQDEQFTKKKEMEVFSKNNWEKCLNFLTTDEQSLKKSFEVGPERRRTEKCDTKLNLLGSVSRNLCQSFIGFPQQTQDLDPQASD